MFETLGKDFCSVIRFEKYVSKLHPDCSAFLQTLDSQYKNKNTWYVNAPLGTHTIGKMLKNMTVDAGLSVKYTNYFLKAISGTVLKKAGCSNKDITA
jgi:hypothetical protein